MTSEGNLKAFFLKNPQQIRIDTCSENAIRRALASNEAGTEINWRHLFLRCPVEAKLVIFDNQDVPAATGIRAAQDDERETLMFD